MARDNWDDLRFVLAVAEEGSVNAAARRLGVNHATVLRRVAAFEEAAGMPLFDKTARGYAVSATMARVIDATREVDRAVQAVGRVLRGTAAPLAGDVRVTSTDSLCQFVLAPIVARIARELPELRVQLLCSNAHLDLGRTHADIAIRPAIELSQDLTGERAALLGFGLFRKAGSAPRNWLGIAGALSRSRVGKWLDAEINPDQIIASADSFLILREMAAEGLGMAILPAFLGIEDPRLEPVADAIPDLSVDIWVASHSDLADVPRISAVRRLLAQALGEQSTRLLGAQTPPGIEKR